MEEKNKLMILITKEAASTEIAQDSRQEIEKIAQEKYCPVTFAFLNGNQNRDGLEQFKKNYEQVTMMCMDDTQGEMVYAARELDIDTLNVTRITSLISTLKGGWN